MSERDDGNGGQDNAWAQLARRLATNDKIIAVLRRENAELRKENSALLAGNEEWEREHDDVKLARDVAIQQAEALGAHVSMIEAHAKRCGMDDPKTSILAMILDRGPETSLARRDAGKKAEALAEAKAACEQVAEEQKKMALMHVEVADDGDEYVGERGIPYSNKALGATHCADDIGRMLNKLRQAEDDS